MEKVVTVVATFGGWIPWFWGVSPRVAAPCCRHRPRPVLAAGLQIVGIQILFRIQPVFCRVASALQ